MGRRRSARDQRRRTHGQNFLIDSGLVRQLTVDVAPDDLVVDLGAGRGALTLPAAAAGARVMAVELDPVWAGQLADRAARAGVADRVRVLRADLRTVTLPAAPYRVLASPPFGSTTALLRRLLADPRRGPTRADLVLQWEVVRKHATQPPRTLLASTWAPWWEVQLVQRIPRSAFRPVPRVDAGWLRIVRRDPALLPPDLAGLWATFLRQRWSDTQGENARTR